MWLSAAPRLLLNATRQSGKSTVAALKAAWTVLEGGLAVVVSASLRQSGFLFRKLARHLIASEAAFRRETMTEVELVSGGLAVSLPGDRPAMLRGLSLRHDGPAVLIVDEASRVPAVFTISRQSRAFTTLRLIDIFTAVHSHLNELATLEFALQQLARLEDELAPDGAVPRPLMLALSCRTRIGTVERANAIAAATLPAEAQRRLTVMPVEITTGYRRPDGQWPPRCPVAWLVSEFNARVASHVETPDPYDRRLGPDQFVVSLRHYRPAESELFARASQDRTSTAEGLLLQPRGEGELIELSDDEAVAAAVMLPMVAADRLAPSASSHTGGAFKRNVRGIV